MCHAHGRGMGRPCKLPRAPPPEPPHFPPPRAQHELHQVLQRLEQRVRLHDAGTRAPAPAPAPAPAGPGLAASQRNTTRASYNVMRTRHSQDHHKKRHHNRYIDNDTVMTTRARGLGTPPARRRTSDAAAGAWRTTSAAPPLSALVRRCWAGCRVQARSKCPDLSLTWKQASAHQARHCPGRIIYNIYMSSAMKCMPKETAGPARSALPSRSARADFGARVRMACAHGVCAWRVRMACAHGVRIVCADLGARVLTLARQ